jgi:tetratricopeptide (TPR) repeat protein
MALLEAFYLNNKDTAITLLERAIAVQGVRKDFISSTKLHLGDIYLLKGESWESALIYAQVEKAEKDRNLGHTAKLKGAKLSYYKGDFEFAKAQLDVLKLATSREIANDAMQLSLLIGDNLELDTSAAALTEFAAIDLLVFQRQYEDALQRYDKMLKDYDGHSLTDEILWAKANILLKQGKFELSIEHLEKLLARYNEDILADDANFLIGKIYEENLKNKEKAMEYYQNQLTKFQGSIYNVEARKRFRTLRGDQVN